MNFGILSTELNDVLQAARIFFDVEIVLSLFESVNVKAQTNRSELSVLLLTATEGVF